MRCFHRRFVNTILFMTAVLSAAQILTSPVQAADPPGRPPEGALAESIRVSPTKFEIQLEPGQETTAPIEIRNGTRDKMKITIAAWNFARDERGAARPIPAKDEGRFRGAASWIEPAKKSITLKSGETTTTILEIRVPKKAALGSYSAYVKIIGTPATQRKESLTVRYIIDALVLPIVMNKSHSVSPSLKTKVEFGGMSTNSYFHTSLPFEIIAKVNNKGNIHQNFDGAIEVWQGKVRLTTIPLKRTLLPSATSVFIGNVEELPYFGKLTARFTGSAFVAKSFRQQDLRGQITFWYIPAGLLYLGGGIGAVFFLSGIILIRRRRASKSKKLPDEPGPRNEHQSSENAPEPTQVS